MTAEDDLWWIPEDLLGVPHARLLAGGMIRILSRVDRRSLDAGLVGIADTELRRKAEPGSAVSPTGEWL